MEIKLAKTAGFCFGVKRAVDMVYTEIGKAQGPLYTYGPIIHNEEVVADLERKGVRVLGEEDLDSVKDGTVIIRSHGVGRDVLERMERAGLRVVDATCPFVKKIHRTVEEASREGRTVIVVGDRNHPEVQGICGWSRTPVYVVETPEEVEALPEFGDVTVVAQTTFNYKKFQELVEKISERRYNRIVVNTICNATQERQAEARGIATSVDAMVVIGGRHSSNTQKLYDICRNVCPDTYYIQTLVDLGKLCLAPVRSVGITAGASTPNYIIEEVFNYMSEVSFEQMLNEEGSLNQIRTGAVVKGTVIGVKENEISMNIGYKADGIITKSEYTNDASVVLPDVVHVGDEMEVKVLKVNDGEGQVALSYRRLAQERNSKKLEEAFENKTVLSAKVTQVLSGGLSVMIDGIRIFIPASMVSDGYERDLNKYADQEIEFVIIEFNPKRRRIIGDRKQVILARKAEAQKALFERIEEGMIVEGDVKNLTDFGAFIDLGGADGLLHISEMSWGRIESPKKVFKVGDHVEVFIKEIKGDKIALSMKFPDRNPWLHADEKYAAGSVVTGRVARMTDFGAFVELEPGVDALLHVSQISRSHVDKPSDVLSIGEEIRAKVVDFNPEDKKISLSIKALEMDEAAAED